QSSRALADESAFGDGLLACAPRDRSGNLGVTEIDARSVDIRLRLQHGCGSGAFGSLGVIQIGPGDESARNQLAITLGADVRVGGVRLRLREGGQRPEQREVANGRARDRGGSSSA